MLSKTGAVSILDLGQPVLCTGAHVEQARAAMLMMHGRGASARDILTLASTLDRPGFAYLAPEAPDHTWYPLPFRAPLGDNEPHLSSSLALIANSLAYLARAGLPPERVILLGFSQGACLVLEYAARHAERYGALVGLSGGLIGPDELPRNDHGSLAATPVYLGCSDVDPHIPAYRVEQAAAWLRELGGNVTLRFYPNMAHTVNDDELDFVGGLMADLQP